MSSGKIRKLLRKTRQARGRNADFYVIHVSPATEQAAEFHREELTIEQPYNFRSLKYDDFPELLRPRDSPLVNRH
jgi:hypothetical protein